MKEALSNMHVNKGMKRFLNTDTYLDHSLEARLRLFFARHSGGHPKYLGIPACTSSLLILMGNKDLAQEY